MTDLMNKQEDNQTDEFGKGETYMDAINRALKRTWVSRFLWVWGIFIPSGFIFLAGYNAFIGSNQEQQLDPKTKEQLEKMEQFINANEQLVIWLIGLLVVIFLFFWVFSTITRSGVIKVIDWNQGKKHLGTYSFKEVWHIGREQMFGIARLDIILLVFMAAVFIVLAIPVVFLEMNQQMDGAAFVSFLAFLLYLPLSLLVIAIRNIGAIHIALAKLSAWDAVERSYLIITKNLRETVKLLGLSFVISVMRSMVAFTMILAVMVIISGITFVVGISGSIKPFWLEKFFLFSFLGISVVGIFLVKSFFALWLQDIWIWWTKKFGGVKTKEEEVFMREGVVVEKPGAITPAVKEEISG